VHRLDRDTSGCLLLARHPKAHRRFAAAFEAGTVEKVYWAVLDGVPAGEGGRIDLPLAKRSPERGWWMRPDPEGLPSVTDYRVLARGGGRGWLALSPLTGRTHQLRVHCAASGFPIVGDAIYGSAPRSGGEPLMLHARRVAVPLYPKRETIVVEAEPPEAMAAAIGRVTG
jgi:tRNA pseudouridine32 synthase / 23S rRNA pseudouridine746 synthase